MFIEIDIIFKTVKKRDFLAKYLSRCREIVALLNGLIKNSLVMTSSKLRKA